MAGRRDNGQGSAYYDAARGKWRGEITLGTRPDGKRDVRKVSADSRAGALRALAEIRRQYEAGNLGTPAQEQQTVAAFLERWLEGKRASVRATTHTRYAETLRLHVLPTLGAVKLKDLKPVQVQALAAQKLRGVPPKAGLHPKTVKNITRTLGTALADGVRWGEVPRNVCALITAVAVPHRELQPPSAPEVATLLATAEGAGDPLAALWSLLAHTGLRLGEATGLRWADVDLESGVLRVRRGLVEVRAGVPTFSEPKTPRSRRTVPLSAPAITSLKAHRARQNALRLKLGEGYGQGIAANLAGGGLVVATRIGTPWSQPRVHGRWRLALERAGLPSTHPTYRVHDLRHAAASQMLAAGTDVVTVSAILGHANPSITLTVYAWAVRGNLQVGVDALAQALTLPEPGAATEAG